MNVTSKNATWTGQALKSGLHGEKPTTNRLSYDTAKFDAGNNQSVTSVVCCTVTSSHLTADTEGNRTV